MSPYLVVIQSLQGSAVTLRIVDTEGREELEHLLLDLAAVGVKGCNIKIFDISVLSFWPRVPVRLASPEIWVDSDWQGNFSTKHLQAGSHILVLIKAKLRSNDPFRAGPRVFIDNFLSLAWLWEVWGRVGRVMACISHPACCSAQFVPLIRQLQRYPHSWWVTTSTTVK